MTGMEKSRATITLLFSGIINRWKEPPVPNTNIPRYYHWHVLINFLISLVSICLKITRPSLSLMHRSGSSKVWEYSQMLPSGCCVAELISSQKRKSRMGQKSSKSFGLVAVFLWQIWMWWPNVATCIVFRTNCLCGAQKCLDWREAFSSRVCFRCGWKKVMLQQKAAKLLNVIPYEAGAKYVPCLPAKPSF